MSIYTKVGDRGKTYTLSSKRKQISKGSKLISALGSLDETNSYLSITKYLLDEKFTKEKKIISEGQEVIFTICAILAGSKLNVSDGKIKMMEDYIDLREKKLPVLDKFVIPQGIIQSHLMFARALVRKSEREVVKFSKTVKVPQNILKFLNRFSDVMFIISRYVNYCSGYEEKVWVVKDK